MNFKVVVIEFAKYMDLETEIVWKIGLDYVSYISWKRIVCFVYWRPGFDPWHFIVQEQCWQSAQEQLSMASKTLHPPKLNNSHPWSEYLLVCARSWVWSLVHRNKNYKTSLIYNWIKEFNSIHCNHLYPSTIENFSLIPMLPSLCFLS